MGRGVKRQVATAPPAQAISSFTRVSKSQAFPDASSKKAVVSESAKKRKASSVLAVQNEESHHQVTKRNVSFAPSSDEEPQTPVKRARREVPTQATKTPTKTPTSQGKARKSPPTPKATPSKASPSKSFQQAKLEDYKYTSRKVDNGADLIRLHKAFLKTVLLHVAHNGRNAPIDMASISPNISRTWGKRAVTVDDIRRCVAIQAWTGEDSPFLVSDYGRGKVCVELKPEWIRENTTINEEGLCRQFERNIRGICAERARDGMCDVDVCLEDMSLSDLPRAEVLQRETGMRANPLVAKGHRALAALKKDIAEKRQDKETAPTTMTVNADGSKMSLLDRIRHKQLARADEPLPPSGPELQRRAALNRVADVAATISMFSLANTAPRQAFTMALMSDKLRDSLRVPISREEGMGCIRLIAGEVAPEWIKVVTMGGRENVVIQRNGQPVDRVLRERVQKLLG